jgi:hypothetical protein
LVAAVDAERAREVDWIRAAVAFEQARDEVQLFDRSESVLILAGNLAEDGVVDLDEFARLRRAIRNSTQ